jgi:dTDP-glucose 4,6-dehydratase
LGTYTLLSAAKKHGSIRFHHISTDEVFGSIPFDSTDEFSENTPYDPSSPYSASKASSDHFVRSFSKTFGLPITITNCSNNYGPFQHPEKLVPRMITNIIEGKKIPVYGAGANFRDWLYVDDHCCAIEAVINKGKLGETYCVGGLKETCRNIDIVKKVIGQMGKTEDQIEYVADRPAHDNYAVSWNKIHTELGWEPKETLDSGLQKTIAWYQANEPWWRTAKLEAEAFYKKLNDYKNLNK